MLGSVAQYPGEMGRLGVEKSLECLRTHLAVGIRERCTLPIIWLSTVIGTFLNNETPSVTILVECQELGPVAFSGEFDRDADAKLELSQCLLSECYALAEFIINLIDLELSALKFGER